MLACVWVCTKEHTLRIYATTSDSLSTVRVVFMFTVERRLLASHLYVPLSSVPTLLMVTLLSCVLLSSD